MPYKDNATRRAAQTPQRRKAQAEWDRRARRRSREFIQAAKTASGCSRCGWNEDPVALDFHHEGDKKADVSRLASNGASLARLQQEIDVCIVLCANCHRIVEKEKADAGGGA